MITQMLNRLYSCDNAAIIISYHKDSKYIITTTDAIVKLSVGSGAQSHLQLLHSN